MLICDWSWTPTVSVAKSSGTNSFEFKFDFDFNAYDRPNIATHTLQCLLNHQNSVATVCCWLHCVSYLNSHPQKNKFNNNLSHLNLSETIRDSMPILRLILPKYVNTMCLMNFNLLQGSLQADRLIDWNKKGQTHTNTYKESWHTCAWLAPFEEAVLWKHCENR